MNVKHLLLLSLCVFPQLTEPVMVFRTSFWRGTYLIRCFHVIWVQTMKAKVRFACLVIGYTSNHSHVAVTNIVLIIEMVRLSVFEKGSFQFSVGVISFDLEDHMFPLIKVSYSLPSSGVPFSPSQILNLV